MGYIQFTNPVSTPAIQYSVKNYPIFTKSIFSDNANVLYKPGTISVGAGTVRNARFRSKRT